jgi:hypothetical protein
MMAMVMGCVLCLETGQVDGWGLWEIARITRADHTFQPGACWVLSYGVQDV